MGRITETVNGVTMATVYVAEEKIYIDGSRKAKLINWIYVYEYIVKRAIPHRGRSEVCCQRMPCSVQR